MNSKRRYIPILRRFIATHGVDYGITRMGIFGSVARGDATPLSDVDLIVEFSRPIGVEFIDLGNLLEKTLGCKVDVVSRQGVKEKYFREIENDIVYV